MSHVKSLSESAVAPRALLTERFQLSALTELGRMQVLEMHDSAILEILSVMILAELFSENMDTAQLLEINKSMLPKVFYSKVLTYFA